MPPRAVSNSSDERPPSGLFKFHSTVFVFLTAWGVVLKSPHGSVLEPEGPTRAHAKSKIVECNLTSPLCLSIPVRTSQALERVQRTTDGPGTPRAPPRCAQRSATVRREFDANHIQTRVAITVANGSRSWFWGCENRTGV